MLMSSSFKNSSNSSHQSNISYSLSDSLLEKQDLYGFIPLLGSPESKFSGY